MRLLILFITALLTSAFVVTSKQNGDDLILWQENVLQWSDFEGKAPRSNTYEAMTHAIIGLEMNATETSVEVNIPVYFSKSKSWSRSDTSTTLLKHEQLHFDIAELVGRKIRQDIQSYEGKSHDATYRYVQSRYKKNVQSTWNKYDSYDRETDHGLIEAKQIEWELKVANELKELSDYSNPKVVISINN